MVESNENVIVTLGSISSGDADITINTSGGADTATVTIADNDSATVSIAASDPAAAEAGSNPGQFTVTQTAVSSTNTTVAYNITGDATAGGTDYATLSGKIGSAAGTTRAKIEVAGVS